MKLNTLFLSLALLQPASAAVGNRDLQEISQLITNGQYEAALQKHLWFHEESKTSSVMGAVRLSFALVQWAELGGKYPKALVAFKGIRDQHEQTLLAGGGGSPEFHEYASFNRTLKEEDKTYALFKRLHANYPGTAAQCFPIAVNLIVARKDYELCGFYMKDPIKLYEDSRRSRELNLNLVKSRPDLVQYAEQAFDSKVCQLIEVMVNLNQVEVAKDIQQRATNYFPTSVVRPLVLNAPVAEVMSQLELARNVLAQRAQAQAQAPRPRYRVAGTRWEAGNGKALLGTWLNPDPQTMSMPKVEITEEAGAYKIRFWGQLNATNAAPFGPPTDLFLLSGHLDSTATNVLNATTVAFATHRAGFADKHFTLHLIDGELQLQEVIIFTDGSRRSNRLYHGVFKLAANTTGTDASSRQSDTPKTTVSPASVDIGKSFTDMGQVTAYFDQRGFVVTSKFENSLWPATLVRLKEAMHEISATLKNGKLLNYSGPGFTGYRLRVATLEDSTGGETVVVLSSKELSKQK